MEIIGIRRVAVEVRSREGQGKAGSVLSGESGWDEEIAETLQVTKGRCE